MSQERRFAALGVGAMLLLSAYGAAATAGASPMDWPKVTQACRPWTYWWWLGSAVDEGELSRHLDAYQRVGMGGVHIVPIYGAKGYETRYINYLSPKWMAMLTHTIREARRLGMGVDMTTGTGWPFGGPWVASEDAAAKVLFEKYLLSEKGRLDQPVRSKQQPEATLRTLMAYSKDGKIVELTSRVDASKKLNWTPPQGTWELVACFQGWTKQQVKRAAPGAEGNVLDYFSRESLGRYLAKFDEAFAASKAEIPRAFYNDSFEVYHANWSDALFDQFERRRGYDLRRYLPALLGEGAAETVKRVKCDYRETINDLLYEEFTTPWVAWSRAKGAITRNQAHGSPGNILDLYAATDVPETEGFGPEGADILVSKFASSAAHLAGRPRTSSESCTWLGEHFQVSLADAKPAIDQLFLAGVNHVFYHGMPFSPADAPYPGWLFYASTHFGLTNSFHRDFRELNEYIARCQSFLQAGRPDPDVLLYFPMYDLWNAEAGAKNLLHYLQVHNASDWLHKNLAPTHEAAKMMWGRGYDFDYTSDRLLAERIRTNGHGLQAGDVRYQAIVLAGCKTMPVRTLERLLDLAHEGATIVVVGDLPSDVPGMGNRSSRLEQHKRLLAKIKPEASSQAAVKEATIGRGRFLIGNDLETLLKAATTRRERMTDQGIRFVRRREEQGTTYFLINRNKREIDGWVPLRTTGQAAVIFDPLRGERGSAAVRQERQGEVEVRLQLVAGQSCVVRVVDGDVRGEPWRYLTPSGPEQTIEGTWQLNFIEGGPTLPPVMTTDRLVSWTQLGDGATRAFSGTGRYAIQFEKPADQADEWLLDLGRVGASARVILNNQPVGTVWQPPYRIRVGRFLQPGMNTLQVEVTNLMANRIADMDRRKVEWRKYFYVNIRYKPFDASNWEPMDSGLLGPVRLIPCKIETAP